MQNAACKSLFGDQAAFVAEYFYDRGYCCLSIPENDREANVTAIYFCLSSSPICAISSTAESSTGPSPQPSSEDDEEPKLKEDTNSFPCLRSGRYSRRARRNEDAFILPSGIVLTLRSCSKRQEVRKSPRSNRISLLLIGSSCSCKLAYRKVGLSVAAGTAATKCVCNAGDKIFAYRLKADTGGSPRSLSLLTHAVVA